MSKCQHASKAEWINLSDQRMHGCCHDCGLTWTSNPLSANWRDQPQGQPRTNVTEVALEHLHLALAALREIAAPDGSETTDSRHAGTAQDRVEMAILALTARGK